jgi:oligoribonuclease NrnB/cAMP/cGMP phosphodiesterase (DHH superfamily)
LRIIEGVKLEKKSELVHAVSHGPGCLDGCTAAVAVARYHRDATVVPHFSSNARINETLLGLRCDPAVAAHEVWITDISWTDPAVDHHLQGLVDAGVRIFWIDHHRTALERHQRGEVKVRFTDYVLDEHNAASRLTYEYLRRRLRAEHRQNEWFEALQLLVAMADDNDRWIHQIPGSRKLGQLVNLLGNEAYRELLDIDAAVTYTPRLREAEQQLDAELRRSFEVAERSRVAQQVCDLTVVGAVCDGYPSEIADAWGETSSRTIFALFDARGLSVSLRRSPDCTLDLSHLAGALGGGGHPAAAGCELAQLWRGLAEQLAALVADAVRRQP